MTLAHIFAYNSNHVYCKELHVVKFLYIWGVTFFFFELLRKEAVKCIEEMRGIKKGTSSLHSKYYCVLWHPWGTKLHTAFCCISNNDEDMLAYILSEWDWWKECYKKNRFKFKYIFFQKITKCDTGFASFAFCHII